MLEHDDPTQLGTSSIETANDSMVASQGDNIVILRFRPKLDHESALRMAAWIVACVGDKERFEKIYEAVTYT